MSSQKSEIVGRHQSRNALLPQCPSPATLLAGKLRLPFAVLMPGHVRGIGKTLKTAWEGALERQWRDIRRAFERHGKGINGLWEGHWKNIRSALEGHSNRTGRAGEGAWEGYCGHPRHSDP